MSNPEVSKSNITNGKATASLILGVISIVLMPVPFGGLILSVVGLILGIVGLSEIKRLNQGGKKTAIAGIVCSGLAILIPILGYIAFMNIDGTVS